MICLKRVKFTVKMLLLNSQTQKPYEAPEVTFYLKMAGNSLSHSVCLSAPDYKNTFKNEKLLEKFQL